MIETQPKERSISPYCILGLSPGCSLKEVTMSYERLIRALQEEKLMGTPQSWVQAQQALMTIENAYKRIVENGEVDPLSPNRSSQVAPEMEEPTAAEGVPPKLGQLLVSAGKISLQELDEALSKQSVLDLPLGEILKGSSLVTQIELDAYLLNQRLIKLPPDSPYLIGQRLIGLGLVTEDMVRIALVDQRATNKPLGKILVERGWLSSDILDALVGF